MSAIRAGVGLFLMAAVTPVLAAASPQQTHPPTTASAEVTQCAQAQMVVDQLLAAATARLDAARQANTAAELRAAVDSLQGTLRDTRAQLAPCGSIQPTPDPHLGHPMPGAAAGSISPATAVPTVKPPATTPIDHSRMPMGTTPAVKPNPGNKPTAAAPMDHSKMPMGSAPAARPVPGGKPPAAAPMDHSKMPMDTAPAAKPAAGAKPSAAAPMDHANMPMGGSANDKSQPTDPVCGLKVDPATAPKASHGGQTYHFCSEQHRELFQKNPAKYLLKAR